MKQFESFQFDTQNECLWRDGVQISIKPKPFSVLRYLIEHPQRLVTHDELLDALWPETYVQPQVLRTYVLELRKLLGDDADCPRFIATIPKRGYRFLVPVAEGLAELTRDAKSEDQDCFSRGIVGRERELGWMDELLRKAALGQRQVVFLTGEAGMGKTAFIDAFRARCSGRVVAARGQCVDGFGGSEPYYPIMELLTELCGGRGTNGPEREQRKKTFAQTAPHWFAQIAPVAAEADGGANSGLNRERMLSELCEGLESVAAAGTALLIILEDLHWADSATLDVLSALARRRTAANLMILGTYRAAEAAAARPALKQLKHDLVSRSIGSVLELQPLSEDSVAAYLVHELAEVAAGSPPKGLASFVHQQSEGNPLYMVATVEHLVSQRLLIHEPTPGMWRIAAPLADVDVGVPRGLSEMIELQVEQRDAREQRLLEAGATIGVIFPVWAAAAALGTDALDAEEQFESLARQVHFLHVAGHDELPDGTRSSSYVFAHRIYREVLYRRQPVVRRSRAHLRVAEKLKTLFAGREARIAHELAIHYECAGAWAQAADAMCASAENAIARRAGAEAAGLLTRSLELLQNLDPQQRAEREARIQQRIFSLAEALDGASTN